MKFIFNLTSFYAIQNNLFPYTTFSTIYNDQNTWWNRSLRATNGLADIFSVSELSTDAAVLDKAGIVTPDTVMISGCELPVAELIAKHKIIKSK